jgi:Zn finger protein HypA/HybF involved in hydrogenase expression
MKNIILQIKCPECGADMNSVCEYEQDSNAIHLMEYEGQEYQCEGCGNKEKVVSIIARNEKGIDIY